MSNAILGTYMIEFEGDGRGVDRAIKETQQSAERGAAKINATIAAGVQGGMEKAAAAARQAGPKLLATYSDLTPILRHANKEASALATKISSGAVVNQRDVQRLAVAEARLRDQIIATFGSVEKATAGAAAGYNRVSAAAAKATDEARRQRIIFEDARKATTEAGFRYTSLSDAAADVARSHGVMGSKVAGGIAKVVAGSFLMREALQAVKLAVVLGAGDEGLGFWVKQLDRVESAYHRARRATYDFYVAQTQFQWARMRGDADGMVNAAKGFATGLLNPVPRGIKADPNAPMSPEDQAAYDEWKAIELSHLARQKDIVSRQLQLAEIGKNATAVRKLTADLALLEKREAVLSGVTDAHAETLRRYTISIRDASQAEASRQQAEQAAARAKAFHRDLNRFATQSTDDWARNTIQNARELFRARTDLALENLHHEREIEAARVALHRASADAIIEASRFSAEMQRSSLDRVAAAYAEQALSNQDVMMASFSSVESFLSNVLTPGAIKNFDDIKDAAKDMLRSIAAEIARMMAQKAVMWFIAQFGGSTLPTGASVGPLISASPGVTSSFTAPATGLGSGFNSLRSSGGGSSRIEPRGGGKQPLTVVVEWSPGLITGIVKAGAAEGAAIASRQVIPIVADNYNGNGALRKIIKADI